MRHTPISLRQCGQSKRVPPRALLIPLPVGQPGDDLHRALDHALHLGQGRLNRHLHLGKRLGRLHPVIPDALEPFGHRVLHHPANKRVDIDGFVLHPLGAVGAVMVRDPLAIIAINAPDGDRRAHHVFGHVARQALILRGDLRPFARWSPGRWDTSGNTHPPTG